jgi:hypothetical protein
MGKCFLYGSCSGGVAFGTKASLVVAVDAGSSVSCSNGTETITADEESGRWHFSLEPGTWTITASLDGMTVSETVVLSPLESKFVTLYYTYYLYNKGNEYADITGGWGAASSYGVLTKGDDYMSYRANTTNWKYVKTANAIDLTGFITIHAIAKYNSTSSSNACLIGCMSDASTLKKSTKFGNSAFTEITVDISDLSGEYFVCFGNAASSETVIQSLWLD